MSKRLIALIVSVAITVGLGLATGSKTIIKDIRERVDSYFLDDGIPAVPKTFDFNPDALLSSTQGMAFKKTHCEW